MISVGPAGGGDDNPIWEAIRIQAAISDEATRHAHAMSNIERTYTEAIQTMWAVVAIFPGLLGILYTGAVGAIPLLIISKKVDDTQAFWATIVLGIVCGVVFLALLCWGLLSAGRRPAKDREAAMVREFDEHRRRTAEIWLRL